MTYRFDLDDVRDLVIEPEYGYNDGIDADVSAQPAGDGLVITLTSTEPDESERVTEKFRVTVERIDPALSRPTAEEQ